MVRVEGNCPISEPGTMVPLFRVATSGSYTGKSFVHMARLRPYKARVRRSIPILFNPAEGIVYSIRASRSFRKEASKELVSTLARLQ